MLKLQYRYEQQWSSFLSRLLHRGDLFGELAVLAEGPTERKADVTTNNDDITTVCWKISREEFRRLTSEQLRQEMLDASTRQYSKTAELHTSPIVRAQIENFYQMMLNMSEGGTLSREAYCEMHLRISKALSIDEDFDMEFASNIANADWGEVSIILVHVSHSSSHNWTGV